MYLLSDCFPAVTPTLLILQVEAQHPGFTYDLIKGILRRGDVLGAVDMTECLLRLEGLNNSDGEY